MIAPLVTFTVDLPNDQDRSHKWAHREVWSRKHRKGERMSWKSVLVLNAGYEPLHRVSLKHAIRMIRRGGRRGPEGRWWPFGHFLRPVVLRLIKYVKMSWRTRSTCTKEAVKRRDGRCAYCTKGKAETVDHVMPQPRGGLNTWLNLVGCCFKCNQRHSPRTAKSHQARQLQATTTHDKTLSGSSDFRWGV